MTPIHGSASCDIARDWARAEQAARLALAQEPATWMLETTLRDIRAVGTTFVDPRDRSQLDRILGLLGPRDARPVLAYD